MYTYLEFCLSFLIKEQLQFRLRLALRDPPSVEPADSATFCSFVCHLHRHGHSQRLAHMLMDPVRQHNMFFFFFPLSVMQLFFRDDKLEWGAVHWCALRLLPHTLYAKESPSVSGLDKLMQRNSGGNKGSCETLEGATALLPNNKKGGRR